MGYDDLKVVEASRLVQSIAAGKPQGATVEDALAAAEIVEAMSESARSGRWVTIRQRICSDKMTLPDMLPT
jgi:predicted dehydrogenase